MFDRAMFMIVSAIFTFNLYAAPCSMAGKQIMEQQEKSQRTNYETGEQEIIILDVKSDVKEKRVIRQQLHNVNSNATKALISFLSPADVKGTALLSVERDNKETDQWLYLPAMKKLQRIASGAKKKYFMGTDLTFADLDGETLSDYEYKCLSEEKCDAEKDKQCFIIEALPINKTVIENTGYSKRILQVVKDQYVTNKVIFFDEKGEELKMMISGEWEKVGPVWRPNKVMIDRQNKHKTFLKSTQREINKKIEESVFTERYILNELHTK